MERVEQAVEPQVVVEHTKFLASVSRHLMASELDPMLEAVARTALPLLGDVCAIDQERHPAPVRLLEYRRTGRIAVDAPDRLASVMRPEIRTEGDYSRLTVPMFGSDRRKIGTLSFAGANVVYGAPELMLTQELADRLALAIENIRIRFDLNEALHQREKLISVAAHELRGPACSLRICVQALHKVALALPPRSVRLLGMIEREERRLSGLIDDLLDLGRIRSGHMQLKIESVNMSELVRDVVARFTDGTPEGEARVQLELSADAVGRWDRARLDQVVTNLVTNALKFGGEQPIRVRVTVDRARACVRLDVIDQGPGIEPALQTAIFEPFKRGGASARHHDGLGLGLYIARNIVEAMQGDIRVASEVGHGATFTVELPQKDGHANKE
jgi:signal transduction histidine kinase